MTIAIRGIGSRIAQELRGLLPPEEEVIGLHRNEFRQADRYLFCQGLLRDISFLEQSDDQAMESFDVNASQVMALCDWAIDQVAAARICVIGSESAFTWSYDGAYAAAKAALHRYVETKRLRTPRQQLVCIAPDVIENCGMTLRRNDKANLESRRAAHPKKRFLQAVEVARLVKFLLYEDEGYISNVVIRVNGGRHANP